MQNSMTQLRKFCGQRLFIRAKCSNYHVLWTRSEERRGARKNTYKRASQLGESIFVDTTGPFPEILIGDMF